ncbi:hypothetical protein IFU40_06780 [Microbacterium sp. CFBP 13617]|uniref:hypothetical protein n=1 Tax=Microbacterium sp. CFBP 13617 TaxID=2774035 RepID=UPI001785600A|nr:hypothetical protein [Microbacterium sp. CFBP 13617]MBD8218335.1 hypothetical protein [Microbacterium sp. CFBP 13617]
MRSWDFLKQEDVPDFWGGQSTSTQTVINSHLLDAVAAGPIPDHPDVEVAVALARFVHEEYEGRGTHENQVSSQEDSATIMRALKAVLRRMNIDTFDPPYRDFDTFYKYWRTSGATGSWQARRDLLDADFEPLHRLLDKCEAGSIHSTLATAISPHQVTGWPRVDEEISELRRHFETATTRQDYSNVGNDVVSVLEALSATVYDHATHGRANESEPPIASTKNRLDRFVEVALDGRDNAELRKLTRASIELAQAVKHRRETVTRLEAGVAADAVILLANMLRRIQG